MALTKTIQAVIFDMDGVISDTQSAQSRAESILLKQYGINMSPDEIALRFSGVAPKEWLVWVFEENKKTLPSINDLVKKKWELTTSLIGKHVREIPGTRTFIERVKNKNLPTAVASASRTSFIEFVLEDLGLKEQFDALCSAEEVIKGKPEPDLFLLAAKKISIPPGNCLVVEDGINGMIAAHRAGMQCIGLVGARRDVEYPADMVVSDLSEVAIDLYINK